MDNQSARIPTRSRRQAMDWSLVLVSQGIETIIEQPIEELGWGLLVRAEDYERALDAIEKYRAENRAWSWPRQRLQSGLIFDWSNVVWIFLLAVCYWLSVRTPGFKDAGILDSRAVATGEWWRVFTAITLHADSAHLAMNCAIGVLLLGLTMGFYGPGIGLGTAFLAGAGGNVAAFLIGSKPHLGLGASGMVLGSLGLLATQWWIVARKNPGSRKLIVTGIFAALLLFTLLGVAPGTDVIAHLGGFVTGLLLGVFLAFVPETWRRNSALNLASGLLLGALITISWSLALRAEQFSSSLLSK